MTLSLRRIAVAVLAAAMVLVGVVAGGPARAATAGGYDHLRPQHFTIVFTSKAPDGVVYASGPIYGVGTNKDTSNTLSVFTFKKGSVNVKHTDVSSAQPKIGKHCIATIYAAGKWMLAGGTGKYKHASGYGKFKFFEVMQLKRDKKGKCDLNQEPKWFFGKVTAWGKATTGEHDH